MRQCRICGASFVGRTCGRYCSPACKRRARSRPTPTDGGVRCEVCGDVFRNLGPHLILHGLNSRTYRQRFPGAATVNEDVRVISRDQLADRVGSAYWTPERIIRAIVADTERRGRPPTAPEWDTRKGAVNRSFGWRGDRPSASRTAKVFGSWMAALEAAGVADQAKMNRAKTHCKHGHPLTGPRADVYVTKAGTRSCRVCQKIWQRERRAKRVLAA
jgi:hypothetical protein